MPSCRALPGEARSAISASWCYSACRVSLAAPALRRRAAAPHQGRLALRGSAITVLFGKGDLTFYAAPLYPTRGVPLRMAVGDLNGDRRPDIVTANRGGSGPAGLNIFLSQGEGRFQALAPIVITGASPSSAAIADLNGDGRADLLVGDGARRVWILLGGGNGTFQTPVSYPAATEVKDVVAVDSNGDGRPDVVAAASDAGVLLYPERERHARGAATSIAGIAPVLYSCGGLERRFTSGPGGDEFWNIRFDKRSRKYFGPLRNRSRNIPAGC